MSYHGYLIIHAIITLRTGRQRTLTLGRIFDCTLEQAEEIVADWRRREPDLVIVGRYLVTIA